MKKLPQRIWVDQDSCWTEKPQNSEGYVEYGREDYHAQALLYVLHKGVKQGKKGIIEKVKNLIKEWSYNNSTEAKYKIEAYKELIEFINEEDKQ